jgi:predicted HD phosphohydrolase
MSRSAATRSPARSTRCSPRRAPTVTAAARSTSWPYGHLVGVDRNARDRYRDHPHFDACAEFCELYDQNCFDPEYESLPLEFFEPTVRRVFAEPRYLDRG